MELIKSLILELSKVQLISLPLVTFSLWFSYKNFSTKSKWWLHRGILISLISLNIVIVITFFSPNIGIFNIPSNFDKEVVFEDNKQLSDAEKSELGIDNSVSANTSGISKGKAKSDINNENDNNSGLRPLSDNASFIKKGINIFSYLPILVPMVSIFLVLLSIIRLFIQSLEERKIRWGSRYNFWGNILIFYSSKVKSPFSLGIISKRVYLPIAYKERDDIDGIILHELAHLYDNHSLWSYIENFYFYIFWFNPFIYILAKRGELLRELIADEKALESVDNLKYSNLLIKELESFKSNGHIYYSLGFSRVSRINERIQNLLGVGKEKASLFIKLFCLSIILITGLSIYGIATAKTIDIKDPDDLSYVNISKVEKLTNQKRVYSQGISFNKDSYLIPIDNKTSVIYNFYTKEDKLYNSFEVPIDRDENLLSAVNSKGELIVFRYLINEVKGSLWNYGYDGIPQKILDFSDLLRPIILMDISSDDTIYLSDLGDIYKVAGNKVVDKISPPSNSFIKDMSIAENGDIYFIDLHERRKIHCIRRVDGVKESFLTNLNNISLDIVDNTLYILDNRGIKRYIDNEFQGYITYNGDFPELIGLTTLKLNKLKDRFLISIGDYEGEYSRIVNYRSIYSIRETLRKRSRDKRKILTVSTNQAYYNRLDYAAKVFNKRQDRVRVEIKQFASSEGNYDHYNKKMNTRVLAGDGEDILFLGGLHYEEFIEKGVLEPLDRYIENDPNFKNNYLSAASSINRSDSVYALNISFTSAEKSLFARESFMKKYGYSGTYINITYDDFFEIMEAERFINEGGFEVSPLGFYRFNLLDFSKELLSLNNYFLSDKKELNRELLGDYLDILYTFNNSKILNCGITEAFPMMDSWASNDIKFFYWGSMDLEHLLMMEKNYIHEKVSSIQVSMDSTSLGLLPINFGINSNSKYKDEAWEFLKILLSREVQSKRLPLYPVNRESFIDKLQKIEKNPNGYNMTSLVIGNLPPVQFIGMRSPTKEEIIETIDYMDSFVRDVYSINELDEYVSKEVLKYCNNKKSKDETISAIAEKYSFYLNE